MSKNEQKRANQRGRGVQWTKSNLLEESIAAVLGLGGLLHVGAHLVCGVAGGTDGGVEQLVRGCESLEWLAWVAVRRRGARE